ncbi:MAG: glycosyltransferase [Saprospiraceae bacterium]|nr:glycosyltransferase [Saprospiraceae bacterium]
MKTILYIGNKLSKHGYTPTTIETLGPLLESTHQVYYASEKKNQLLRLFDISWSCIRWHRKVDIVLIDTYGTSAFYIALTVSFICRLVKLHYIPILHGGNLPLRLQNSPLLCQWIFKYSYQNVAPSGYMQAIFSKHGYGSQIIPNPINIYKYSFKYRENIYPRILWVRSFAELYNPDMAIQVLKQLLNNYPEATLCMIGPDKYGSLERCKRLAQDLAIIESVTFPGKMSKFDWHQLSKNYDIFINTTNVDNAPVSVIEAMALGLPIVSTSVGGIPFLFENRKEGFMVEVGNVDEMVNTIEFLLKYPTEVARISFNARQKSMEWAFENVKTKWDNLLNKIV